MSLRSPYDTPEDGDFARYVEQLGRSAAPTGAAEAPSATAAASPGASTKPRRPPRTALPARGGASPWQPVWRWVQWGIVLYVAVEVFASVFPAYRTEASLLLLVYLGVAFLRLRELPWSQILADLRPRK